MRKLPTKKIANPNINVATLGNAGSDLTLNVATPALNHVPNSVVSDTFGSPPLGKRSETKTAKRRQPVQSTKTLSVYKDGVTQDL